VSPLVPVSGKGDVKFLASVTLDIGGIVLVHDGWTLRQDKAGAMRPYLPAYRDPRTGAWAACVELPENLLRAVGEALLAQVPGAPGLIRPPGGAPDSA
jgi:hypothetical protein